MLFLHLYTKTFIPRFQESPRIQENPRKPNNSRKHKNSSTLIKKTTGLLFNKPIKEKPLKPLLKKPLKILYKNLKHVSRKQETEECIRRSTLPEEEKN
jgi:hypothetical protein